MLVGDSCTCITVVDNFVTLYASLLLTLHGKRYLFEYLLIYSFVIAVYYCISIDDDNDD